MNLFLKTFDPTYWTDAGGSLNFQGHLLENTTFFKVNPLAIQALGGDRFSVLNPVDIKTFAFDATAPDIIVPNASDYTWDNWVAAGWDGRGDLMGEVGAWVQNNFSQPALLPLDGSYNLLFLYGVVNGTYYGLPLVYVGNFGDATFPVDGGTFTNTSFPNTVDGGDFIDTNFSPIIDGGNF